MWVVILLIIFMVITPAAIITAAQNDSGSDDADAWIIPLICIIITCGLLYKLFN